jgi:HAD superfamily hydrolase (TIGR01509 family)
MITRAVLFDFDGVLADTENVHIAAWERTFAAMGWEVPPEQCLRAVEVDDRQFLTEVFNSRGISRADVEGWVRRKQMTTRRMLRDQPRVIPGVVALIERLRERVRLAVVSTTWRENIETVLTASGLRDAFTLIVGKEDVRAFKPDPEGYKLALSGLKVSPEEAVALEDSALGVQAALDAGLRCVVVGRQTVPDDSPSPSLIRLADLTETETVLLALGLG